jgi:hypothetical protein
VIKIRQDRTRQGHKEIEGKTGQDKTRQEKDKTRKRQRHGEEKMPRKTPQH